MKGTLYVSLFTSLKIKNKMLSNNLKEKNWGKGFLKENKLKVRICF